MSHKINAIVFSIDKAAQLRIFLESTNKYAPGVFDINVIVSHTSEDFDKGYGMVINDPNFSHVNFVMQDKEFKGQVLSLLKTEHDYSCFFMDDDIIYKEVKLEDITSQIESDEDVVCFSLRLGENVTKCYTLDADNVMHDMERSGNTMKWDWSLHYLDFGYPFSLNGHTFRRKDIYKLVRKSKFTGLEELEMALFDFAEMFPRNKMVSYKHSALVNVPIGRVQMSVEHEMTMTLKDVQAKKARQLMNEQFIKGEAPRFEELDFLNLEIEGCHQELDLGFSLSPLNGGLDAISSKKFGKLFDDLTEEQQKETEKLMKLVQK
jgi:hypothetical protein